MVYTKLERSFDSSELHKILNSTLTQGHGQGHSRSGGVHKIERPPLPRGSQAYEQVKDELEIERQSHLNGNASLPVPIHSKGGHSASSHLSVPSSSPVSSGHRHRPGSSRGGHRTPTGRLSPLPPHFQGDNGLHAARPTSGRRSPYLDLPTSSQREHGSRSRSVSPRPQEEQHSPTFRGSPSNSRPGSHRP